MYAGTYRITRATGVNEVTIDWGDGNTETTSKTSYISHSYGVATEDREITVSIYGRLTYLCFDEDTLIYSIDFRKNGGRILVYLDEAKGASDTTIFGGKYLYRISNNSSDFTSMNIIDCDALEICGFPLSRSMNICNATKITEFSCSLFLVSNIRCINVSSVVYDYLNTLISKGTTTGTLTTDNSSESAALRATAASKGWTVIIE